MQYIGDILVWEGGGVAIAAKYSTLLIAFLFLKKWTGLQNLRESVNQLHRHLNRIWLLN